MQVANGPYYQSHDKIHDSNQGFGPMSRKKSSK